MVIEHFSTSAGVHVLSAADVHVLDPVDDRAPAVATARQAERNSGRLITKLLTNK
jgi:hypothetical protein